MGTYRHRQFGKTVVVALGAGVALCLILAMLLPGRWISLTVALILLICLMLFSSLSVEVSERYLSWSFGFGVIRKRVLLSEIASAEATKTTLRDGWGIHLTSRGWVYNVSGVDAVAIGLKSGKRFVLGTDQPDQLVLALRPRQVAS